MNKNDDCSKMKGCGVYTGNGIQITEDGSILVENGVERKLNKEETVQYIDKLMGQ